MAWNTNGNANTQPTDFLGTTDARPLAVRTNNAEAARVTAAGRVGIGTQAPQSVLHVGNGQTAIQSSRVTATIAATQTDAGIAIAQGGGVNVLLQASGAGGYIGTTSNHPLVFRTGDQDRMVILPNGDLQCNGDILLTNADCAEDFDLAEDAQAEPGTVMVLDDDGRLTHCVSAYDRRVAGIVAGAGTYRPAIVLDRANTNRLGRSAISLVGKAFCKVDATDREVGVGDLLTTSGTPGHAMAAADPSRAFGSVLGKALRPLRGGIGLVPVLIALQ